MEKKRGKKNIKKNYGTEKRTLQKKIWIKSEKAEKRKDEKCPRCSDEIMEEK